MEFNWKSLGESVVKAGLPILGGALMGPGGAAIGSMVAGALGYAPDALDPKSIEPMLAHPETMLALRKLELEHQQFFAKLAADQEQAARAADSADIAVVNATMQTEAKSEHWLQWAWRPLNGISLALGSFVSVLGVLWLGYVAITTKDPGVLNMVPALVSGIAMVLAIPGAVCGVTAWHRGVTQRLQAGTK